MTQTYSYLVTQCLYFERGKISWHDNCYNLFLKFQVTNYNDVCSLGTRAGQTLIIVKNNSDNNRNYFTFANFMPCTW